MFCRKIPCLGRCMGKVCCATVGRSRLCSDHGRIVPTMELTCLGFPLCSGMAPSSLLVAVAHVVLWSFATCLQVAVEWLRQGCHAWFLWVFLVFGALHFPLRFPFKGCFKIVLRLGFGNEIRSWSRFSRRLWTRKEPG